MPRATAQKGFAVGFWPIPESFRPDPNAASLVLHLTIYKIVSNLLGNVPQFRLLDLLCLILWNMSGYKRRGNSSVIFI